VAEREEKPAKEEGESKEKAKDDARPIDPEKLRESIMINIRRRRVMIGDPISGARLEEIHDAVVRETDDEAVGSKVFAIDLFGQDDDDMPAGDVTQLTGSSLGQSDFQTMRENIMKSAAGLGAGIPGMMASLGNAGSNLGSRRASTMKGLNAGMKTSVNATPQTQSRLGSRRVSFAVKPSPAISTSASPRASIRVGTSGADGIKASPQISAKASPRVSFTVPAGEDTKGSSAGSDSKAKTPLKSGKSGHNLSVNEATDKDRTKYSSDGADSNGTMHLSPNASPRMSPRISPRSSGAAFTSEEIKQVLGESQGSDAGDDSDMPLATIAERNQTKETVTADQESEKAPSESSSEGQEIEGLPTEMLELRQLLSKFPSKLLLKDIASRDERIGHLTVEMLLRMIDEGDEDENDDVPAVPVIEEEDEDDEDDDDELADDLNAHVLDQLQLDPHVAQEVYGLLMQLQGGMKGKGCKCEPGMPHTCMSPSVSVFVSQVASLAHSISHSIAHSLSATAHASRRQSLSHSKFKGRMSLSMAMAEDVNLNDEDGDSEDSNGSGLSGRAATATKSLTKKRGSAGGLPDSDTVGSPPPPPPPPPMGATKSLTKKRGSAGGLPDAVSRRSNGPATLDPRMSTLSTQSIPGVPRRQSRSRDSLKAQGSRDSQSVSQSGGSQSGGDAGAGPSVQEPQSPS
jgi:hypothetical protein